MTTIGADDFLRMCYRVLLGRDPDISGFKHHMNALLENNFSNVLKSFIESDEFYRKFLLSENSRHVSGDVYYFFHIPKTAGMFFKQSLIMRAGSNRVFPGYYVTDLFRSIGRLQNYRFFSGHFLGYLDAILGIKTRKATLLRDPIDRAISHYFHYQRDPSLPLYEQVKNLSISEILSENHLCGFLRNYQSKYLATLAESDGIFTHAIEIHWHKSNVTDNQLFEQALCALDMIECVGLQSDLTEFDRHISSSWGLPPCPQIEPVNMGQNRNDLLISKHDYSLLCEANEVDIKLYNTVKKMVKKI